MRVMPSGCCREELDASCSMSGHYTPSTYRPTTRSSLLPAAALLHTTALHIFLSFLLIQPGFGKVNLTLEYTQLPVKLYLALQAIFMRKILTFLTKIFLTSQFTFSIIFCIFLPTIKIVLWGPYDTVKI